jgi:hypothetical protein
MEPTGSSETHQQVAELVAEVAALRADLDSLKNRADDSFARADKAEQRQDDMDERADAMVDRADRSGARSAVDPELLAELQSMGVVHDEHVAQLEKALVSARALGAAIGNLMESRQVWQDDAFAILREARSRASTERCATSPQPSWRVRMPSAERPGLLC